MGSKLAATPLLHLRIHWLIILLLKFVVRCTQCLTKKWRIPKKHYLKFENSKWKRSFWIILRVCWNKFKRTVKKDQKPLDKRHMSKIGLSCIPNTPKHFLRNSQSSHFCPVKYGNMKSKREKAFDVLPSPSSHRYWDKVKVRDFGKQISRTNKVEPYTFTTGKYYHFMSIAVRREKVDNRGDKKTKQVSNMVSGI